MTQTTLQTRSEYKGLLPTELRIDGSTEQTLVFDQIQNSTITVGPEANTTIVVVLKKGWEELRQINFIFEAENSSLNFIALVLGTESEEFPLEAVATHKVPHTKGSFFIRAAMFDRSKVDFRGNIIIEKAAQETDSYLAHHSLMLSDKAQTKTEPCLEIEADNVAAGHAATVGRVDDDMLFYLNSRGINKKQAQEMLIRGFLEHDLAKIPNEELRQALAEDLESSLEPA
jgi:Fe-S cluster assembly protein SufD